MFFFNLSVVEFLALLGSVSGAVTALYLLDRTRRKVRVPTLRFWVHSESPSEMRHRRRIQQPWSLLLQLVSLLLLLLALAQLRWGSPADLSRDHVLILDTSAVMAASTGQQTWMDQAREQARAWLAKVPSGDRVMLVRADALPAAATAFESNRKVIEEALAQAYPSTSALRLETALRFARQAQAAHGKGAGEIVFAGAGWSAEEDSSLASKLGNLRVLRAGGELENTGLRKIGVRRSAANTGNWEAYVTVRNFGKRPRLVPVAILFGGSVVAQRQLTLAPASEQSFTAEVRTEAAGILETRLQARDAFPGDDRATLELPSQMPSQIAIYSREPNLLRPVFSAAPGVRAEYLEPSAYDPAVDAALVVLDRMNAAAPSKAASLWIDPPAGSPIPAAGRREDVTITRWLSDHPLGTGLRATDARLESAVIFQAASGDIVAAEAAGGPVVLARPSRRWVAIGFNPMQSALRYELTTPLLFANAIRWLAPQTFVRWEVNAGSAGSVAVPLETGTDPAALAVKMDGGGAVPFSSDGRTVQFFSGAPGVVRVKDGRREIVYSLTLPELATAAWKPPPTARMGVPDSIDGGPLARDLWQWLALAGSLGLAAEWFLFGRSRRLFRAPAAAPQPLRRAS
jgi:hypothetical protein